MKHAHILAIILVVSLTSFQMSYGNKLNKFDFTPESISSIRAQAENGDPYFQALYGGMAIWGYVENPNIQTPKNNEELDSQAKKSISEIGDDWLDVAESRIDGSATSEIKQNNDWIEKSAHLNNPIGLYFKACRLEKAGGIRDIGEIRSLWASAFLGLDELSKKGDPVALTLVGLINENGSIAHKSEELAIVYYSKGVENRSALAAHQLSAILLRKAESEDDYREVLRLNYIAQRGRVKGAQVFNKEVLTAAENHLAVKAIPLLPFKLPGEYIFENFFSRAIVRIGGLVGLIIGGLFGWFIFPWCLAPIKLLIHSPMEIFVDRLVGVFAFAILACVMFQLGLIRLFS